MVDEERVVDVEEQPSWDDATRVGNFVSFETDKEKVIEICHWKLETVDKFGDEQIELTADVTEEDGKKPPEGRIFSTTSARLKKKLRPLLEGKDVTEKIKVSILRVGDKFDTQFFIS